MVGVHSGQTDTGYALDKLTTTCRLERDDRPRTSKPGLVHASTKRVTIL